MKCQLCGAEVGGGGSAPLWLRCRACGTMVFRAGPGPRVVIGHESEEISEQIGAVLLDAGLSPVRAADGEQVMQILSANPPAAVVLDVALDKVLTYQVVEHLQKTPDLAHVRSVLVASVFRKTAYKRRPQSLYGADDYIEQHHIPDGLVKKLATLLGYDVDAARKDVMQRRTAIEAVEERPDLAGALRVRALAHSIVADIALYHQGEFERAVRGDHSGLGDAIAEGRRLLAEMVDPKSYAGRDPIVEALNVFLSEMRRAER